MYGLINQAVQGLIIKEFGKEKWQQIRVKAGIQDEFFQSMRSYDDKVTYDLLGAASEILEVDAGDLLEAFGEYWVLYTAEEGYGELLDLAGSTFEEFLGNLNHLHKRVAGIMPDLTPPVFETVQINEQELQLRYTSKREGLTPMVIGLIKGLGKRFDLKDVQIVQEVTKNEGEYATTPFNISWKSN
jgi:hypothetical protein